MAQKLFVGGLPFSTSSERVREVFAQAGVVESVEADDTAAAEGARLHRIHTAESQRQRRGALAARPLNAEVSWVP